MLARALGPVIALVCLLVPAADAMAAKGQLTYEARFPEYDTGGAQDVAASPDGKFLYVAGGNKLTVFSRDEASGAFAFLESEVDGNDDPGDSGGAVLALDPAQGVAISPDGETVYVAAWQPGNAVVVFDRDPATGRVSYLESERDGVDDPGDSGGAVEALFRAESVAVSPDGESVYAITDGDDSVVVFDRDTATGRINYVETEIDGVNDAGDAGGTVDGLQGGTDITVTPDGEAVYATASSDDSVVVFERDAGSGELSYVEFERDGIDDAGDAGGTVDGLNGASSVAATGNFVYAAGSFDAGVAMFARDDTTQRLSFVEAEKEGVDDAGDAGPAVSGLLGPRSLALSANGLSLYVACSTASSVVTFRTFPAESELQFVEAETEGVDPGGGDAVPSGFAAAAAVTVPAGGTHVYVAGAGASGLAAFARAAVGSPTLGRLSFLSSAPAFNLRSPRGAAISPDGELIVAGTADGDSLISFDRDPATGAVARVDVETQEVDDPSDAAGEAEGLEEPRAIAFAPNGTDVYVTDTSEYAVSLFRINAAGELSYVETERDGDNDPEDGGGTVEGLYEPWDVVVAPDGGAVYAAGSNDDTVVAFDRDTATGRLSFVEKEEEGVGGVAGLSGVEGLAISPDGKNLYAAGTSGEEAAVFARNPATDALTFLEAETDGVDDPNDAGGTVEGFEFGPNDVVVSRDGSQVYFGAYEAVTRFQRDETTGRIAFAEAERDGLDGHGSVERMEVSRDGGEVYASVYGGLLAYSSAGASLALLDSEILGVDTGDGGGRPQALMSIADILVSPDDLFVYSVSEGESGLGLFAREPGPPVHPGGGLLPPAPEVADNVLLGPLFKAGKKQAQKGQQVIVKLTLGAGESATGTGSGKVTIGKRSYKLKPVTVALAAGGSRALKLKPAKAAHRKAIIAALQEGAKVKARLTGKIVDPAGNVGNKNLPTVTLTYKR